MQGAQWFAGAGEPLTGGGPTFTWTAPNEEMFTAIAVSVPDMARLANDPDDAVDCVFVQVVIPYVVQVHWLDYGVYEDGFREQDAQHSWTCDGWADGTERVPVPQWDVTVTPPVNEPAFWRGGHLPNWMVGLRTGANVFTDCAIEVQGDGGQLTGGGTVGGSGGVAGGAGDPRPQIVQRFVDRSVEWEYKVPDGSDTWITMNASVHHVIYQSYGDPTGIATQKRADQVCGLANGQWTPEGIADPIWGWLTGALPDGYGSIAQGVAPWCYLDEGAPVLECDDQANVMRTALALVGVPADVQYVHASTDRGNCLDQEERDQCPVCGQYESLCLWFGDANNYEGCCHVESDERDVLYAVWDGSDDPPKASEDEVTQHPPDGLQAAALSMLNKLSCEQWWCDDELRQVHLQPKPSL